MNESETQIIIIIIKKKDKANGRSENSVWVFSGCLTSVNGTAYTNTCNKFG